MTELKINQVDFHKTINMLIYIFKNAAELQKECGNEFAEDIYEQMAVKLQYREWQLMLVKIAEVVSTHQYDVRKILKTALNPKLDPFERYQSRFPEVQNSLPEISHDWEVMVEQAIIKITRSITKEPA